MRRLPHSPFGTSGSSNANIRAPFKAVHLLEVMILQWNPPPTLISFNAVIDTCTKTKGYLQQAYRLFWKMQCLGLQPNVVTFTSLISAFDRRERVLCVVALPYHIH